MTLEEAIKERTFRDRDVFVFRDPKGKLMILHRPETEKWSLIEHPRPPSLLIFTCQNLNILLSRRGFHAFMPVPSLLRTLCIRRVPFQTLGVSTRITEAAHMDMTRAFSCARRTQ